MEHPLASNSGSLAPLPLRGTVDPSRPDKGASGPSLSFQDEQTLSQLRRGNWAAMEGLVQRYQDRLYVTVLRMVNHREDAADLVQETFLEAQQDFGRFAGTSETELLAWLRQILLNNIGNFSRRYHNTDKRAVSREVGEKLGERGPDALRTAQHA